MKNDTVGCKAAKSRMNCESCFKMLEAQRIRYKPENSVVKFRLRWSLTI